MSEVAGSDNDEFLDRLVCDAADAESLREANARLAAVARAADILLLLWPTDSAEARRQLRSALAALQPGDVPEEHP